MKQMQFSVEINATKQKVWDTLWQDATLRKWAGLIDPGTYMKGELKEGNEVEFISEGGYGVTSLVDTLVPYEHVLLKHKSDTQDTGAHTREDQWTGGTESYTLTENNGITTLISVADIPEELEDIMNASYPKAFNRIKELAEGASV